MSKKPTISATPDQLENLYKALSVGTPITIALSMVDIPLSTYYYWVAVYSVVVYCKEQEELEEIEKLSKAGISIQEIKDMTAAATMSHRKSQIGTYIEPKQETVLRYKKSFKFRDFANEVYEIIKKCNETRSKVVVSHLATITKSTSNKSIKASGSMWFLERTLGDYFGRAQDKVIEEENSPGAIPSIQVEFINPEEKDSKQHLQEMEQLVLQELKGMGEA